MERGAVGFGDIIEEQLQLEGMRRRLPGNTETHSNEAAGAQSPCSHTASLVFSYTSTIYTQWSLN